MNERLRQLRIKAHNEKRIVGSDSELSDQIIARVRYLHIIKTIRKEFAND